MVYAVTYNNVFGCGARTHLPFSERSYTLLGDASIVWTGSVEIYSNVAVSVEIGFENSKEASARSVLIQ